MLRRVFFCAPVVAALVACGSGGGGTPSIPTTPVVTPTTTPTTAPTVPTVQFTIGQSQSVQVRRKPLYFSPHTESVVVTYNGTPYAVNFIQGTPPCTGAIPNLVCTVQFTAAVGSDSFAIAAYDAYNGSGKLLSKTQVTANVVVGLNKVQAVLDGVPASATLQKTINVPEAVATSVPFTVTAYDADGAAIVGPGNYAPPIPLSDSDTSGGTTVSASVTAPGTLPVVTYNGTASLQNAYVSTSLGYSGGNGGLIRVVPQYAQYNTPSGRPAVDVAAARDGSLWVMEGASTFNGSMAAAHISASGGATEFVLNSSLGQGISSMVVAPDGAVWCITGPMHGPNTGEILRIDTAGNVSSSTNASISNFVGRMVVGPDNRLWFAQSGGVGAIDTSTNYVTFYNDSNAYFNDITVGSDGNLWATDAARSAVVRITTSGAMTSFPMPAGFIAPQPLGITTQGSTLVVTSNDEIYQFDTSGNVLKTYNLPNLTNGAITTASNGSVWIPMGDDMAGGSVIARWSSGGAFSTVSVPYPKDPGFGAPSITHLATATDASMWYVRDTAYGKIVVH